jgi:hypothetical protein
VLKESCRHVEPAAARVNRWPGAVHQEALT